MTYNYINIKKISLLLFVFFLLTGNAIGQEQKKYTYSISAAYFSGIIIRHSKEIGISGNSFPTGGWIEFNKHHYGGNLWESRHNFPDFGVTLSYVDYNNAVTGKSIGISPHHTVYFSKNRSKKHFLKYKMGFGLGYNTHPYSKDLNHQNQQLGSRFTFSIPAVLSYEMLLKNQWSLSTGIAAIHFSNGSIKKPNKGINVASLFAEIRFNTTKHRPDYTYHEDTFSPQKPGFTISSGFGINEANFIGAGAKPFITLSLYADKRINNKIALLAGADVFWTWSLKEDIRYDLTVDQTSPPDYRRVAVTAGFEYFINKLSVIGQLGVYVYDPYHNYSFFYERVGLKYYLSEKIFTGVAIKAHYASGELAEFGIGYRL